MIRPERNSQRPLRGDLATFSAPPRHLLARPAMRNCNEQMHWRVLQLTTTTRRLYGRRVHSSKSYTSTVRLTTTTTTSAAVAAALELHLVVLMCLCDILCDPITITSLPANKPSPFQQSLSRAYYYTHKHTQTHILARLSARSSGNNNSWSTI